MELVKTQDLISFCNLQANAVKRVSLALVGLQLAMNLSHEFMKMETSLALDIERFKEQIHDEAFTSTHATPKPEALGRFLLRK